MVFAPYLKIVKSNSGLQQFFYDEKPN